VKHLNHIWSGYRSISGAGRFHYSLYWSPEYSNIVIVWGQVGYPISLQVRPANPEWFKFDIYRLKTSISERKYREISITTLMSKIPDMSAQIDRLYEAELIIRKLKD